MQLSCLPPCAPASTYLVLADVVVVCGALSSLLQCDKDETSEISGAGCHEDHWRANRERMWINSSRRPTVAPTRNQGYITGCRVSADDARNKLHFCECVHQCTRVIPVSHFDAGKKIHKREIHAGSWQRPGAIMRCGCYFRHILTLNFHVMPNNVSVVLCAESKLIFLFQNSLEG